MADPKFTEGSWRAKGPNRYLPGRMTPTFEIVSDSNAFWVAHTQNEADARLISAVPDLYEALIAVIPTHRNPADRCWCGHGQASTHTAGCIKARAALAKAEGTEAQP